MSNEPGKVIFKAGQTNPVDYVVHQENMAREYQIAVENMGIVRERLSECLRTEGINQFTNCKELREQYFALCKDRFRGMVLPPEMEKINRDVPGLLGNNKK